MFRKSIKQKIVGIAAGLIVLAVITSILSMVMSARVGHLLDELTNRYVPAYGDLARVNVRSLERGLALRQMIIAKMENPPDEAAYAAHLKTFQSLGSRDRERGAGCAQQIAAIIDDPSTPSDNAALGRLDDRIDNAVNDLHHRLDELDTTLLGQLDARDFDGLKRTLAQADALRGRVHAEDRRHPRRHADSGACQRCDRHSPAEAGDHRFRPSSPESPRCSASCSR